jgi:hypothetical protein
LSAGDGTARISISFAGWEEARIAPLALEVPVQEARWSTIAIWGAGWTLGVLALVAVCWFVRFVARKRVRSRSACPSPAKAGEGT